MYKEKVFNIGYGDDYIAHKESDIRLASINGLKLIDNTTGKQVRQAASYKGMITVVDKNGRIYKDWAGNFTVTI